MCKNIARINEKVLAKDKIRHIYNVLLKKKHNCLGAKVLLHYRFGYRLECILTQRLWKVKSLKSGSCNEQNLKICEEHVEIKYRTSANWQFATFMILHSVQIKHANAKSNTPISLLTCALRERTTPKSGPTTRGNFKIWFWTIKCEI